MNSVNQNMIRTLRNQYRDFTDPLQRRTSHPDEFVFIDERVGLVYSPETSDVAYTAWAALGYLYDLVGPNGTETLHERPEASVLQDICRREVAYLKRATLDDWERNYRLRLWSGYLKQFKNTDRYDELPPIVGRKALY